MNIADKEALVERLEKELEICSQTNREYYSNPMRRIPGAEFMWVPYLKWRKEEVTAGRLSQKWSHQQARYDFSTFINEIRSHE